MTVARCSAETSLTFQGGVFRNEKHIWLPVVAELTATIACESRSFWRSGQARCNCDVSLMHDSKCHHAPCVATSRQDCRRAMRRRINATLPQLLDTTPGRPQVDSYGRTIADGRPGRASISPDADGALPRAVWLDISDACATLCSYATRVDRCYEVPQGTEEKVMQRFICRL